MAWDSEDKKELKKLFKTIIDNLEYYEHFAVITVDGQGNLQTVNASADEANGFVLVGALESLKFKLLKEYHDDDGVLELNVDED